MSNAGTTSHSSAMPDEARLPLGSVLVKPAGPDCNLRCAYCFYLRKAALFGGPRHRMSEAVLDLTVRKALEAGARRVAFGWQGGEPTLMGLDFFRRAVDLQRKYRRPRQEVANGLQTNGFVVDEAWCDFLREQRFLVGLSLDGPEHVHDRYRRTADGRGTFRRVREAAGRMLAAGVEVNALVVINDYSARFAGEIYDFLKEVGFRHMQFIPCVEPHPEKPGRTAPFTVSARAYGRFLCEVADRWLGDFRNGWPTVYIRHFESLLHVYCGVPPPDCVLAPTCGRYVVVEHNGEVFSCDFFVTPDCRLGNVAQDDLEDLLNSPRQRAFGARKADLPPACRGCEWLRLCYGGCLKDRDVGTMRDGRSHLCAGIRMFLSHVDKPMRKLAERWRKAQARSRRASAPPEPRRNAPCPCGSGKKFKDCCARGPALP